MKKKNSQMDDGKKGKGLSRRDFVKTAAAGAVAAATMAAGKASKAQESKPALSKGYILVDSKKCSGCSSCMLACSLVNEGVENLSLSRIQIIQTSFGRFPDDISIQQCRQCVIAPCVEACPAGALFIDAKNGNIRRIDKTKCKDYQAKSNGCQRCNEACPYTPSMALWNHEKKIAAVCDLCSDAQFWKEKGGLEGKQACVEICPVKAIKFVKEVPSQKGNKGYDVNLRNAKWGYIGFPTN